MPSSSAKALFGIEKIAAAEIVSTTAAEAKSGRR
jgi:hypothetical protein